VNKYIHNDYQEPKHSLIGVKEKIVWCICLVYL